MMQPPTSLTEVKQHPGQPSAAEFRSALRSYAGAVTIVAAGLIGERCGLTATAVCSVSDNPPTMLACVNVKSAANAQIAAQGCFSINVLASIHHELAKRFAGHDGLSGEERFTTANWSVLATGAPVLMDALVVLDCRLIEARKLGSHTVFMGTVAACRSEPGLEPLVYVNGGFRELA